jgi:hypothetical protein
VQHGADAAASRNLAELGASAPLVFPTVALLAPFASSALGLAESVRDGLGLSAPPRELMLHAAPPSPLPEVRSLKYQLQLAKAGRIGDADKRLERLFARSHELYALTAAAVDADVATGRLRPIARTPPAITSYGACGVRPCLLVANYPLQGDTAFVQEGGSLHAHTELLALRGMHAGGQGTVIINRLSVVAVLAGETYDKARAPSDLVPLAADGRAEQLVHDAVAAGLLSTVVPM